MPPPFVESVYPMHRAPPPGNQQVERQGCPIGLLWGRPWNGRTVAHLMAFCFWFLASQAFKNLTLSFKTPNFCKSLKTVSAELQVQLDTVTPKDLPPQVLLAPILMTKK